MTLWKTLVVALVAAFTLAACSSSNNDASSMTEEPAPPAGPNQAEMQTEAIMTAASALTAAVAGLDGANPTRGQIDAVDSAITGLQNALTAAVDVDDAVKAGYQAQVASARQAAMNADDALTAAAEAAAREAAAEMEAMARKLFAGLSQNDALTGVTNPTPAQTANRALMAGRFISLSSTAVEVDTDATDGGSIMVKKSGTAVPDLGGWSGADYVQTRSGATDHVVLYHNRGTASQSFSEKHGAIIDAGAGDDLGTYSIPQADLAAANSLSFVKSGDFATSGTKPHTEDADEEVEVRGTFDGVSGTYSCTQDGATGTCTSTINANGQIVLGGGGTDGWTFSGFSLNAMTQTPDAAYLVFGWWSRESPAGVDVAALAGSQGTVPSGNDAANEINGTATYKGGAAGKYAVYNPLGDNSSAGAFTANAELTADFTNDRISGELTDFMSGGEEMDWAVALNAGDGDGDASNGVANITDDGISNGTPPSTVWTMGGTADDPRGAWSGNFYGPNSATAESTTATPAAVIGTFTAMYQVGGLEIGQMIGAFGAEEE